MKCRIEKCKNEGMNEVELKRGKTFLCAGHYKRFENLDEYPDNDKKIAILEEQYNFTL